MPCKQKCAERLQKGLDYRNFDVSGRFFADLAHFCGLDFLKGWDQQPANNHERVTVTELTPEDEIDPYPYEPIEQIIRENLRMAIALRGRQNMKEVSLAAQLSENVLAQFLNGSKSIKTEGLWRICQVLDIPVGLLFEPESMTRARIAHYREFMNTPDLVMKRAFASIYGWDQSGER